LPGDLAARPCSIAGVIVMAIGDEPEYLAAAVQLAAAV
jgi:hypothetical protein